MLTVIVNSGTVLAARLSLYPEYDPPTAEDVDAGAAAAAGWNPEKITGN